MKISKIIQLFFVGISVFLFGLFLISPAYASSCTFTTTPNAVPSGVNTQVTFHITNAVNNTGTDLHIGNNIDVVGGTGFTTGLQFTNSCTESSGGGLFRTFSCSSNENNFDTTATVNLTANTSFGYQNFRDNDECAASISVTPVTPTPTPTPTPTIIPTPNPTPTGPFAPSNGSWMTVGNLSQGRQSFSLTTLLDGRAIVAGGQRNDFGPFISYAELYNPLNQTWSQTGSLLVSRQLDGDSIATLQNGKVLVAGGRVDNNPLAESELYNPDTQQWLQTGSLNTPRRAPSNIVVLDDGRALVTGGSDVSSGGAVNTSELYNPLTGQWSYSANTMSTNRIGTKMIKLPSGKVLVVGGSDLSGNCVNVAEIFDPNTNMWSSAGTVPFSVSRPYMNVLQDGRVFVTGGYCATNSNASAIYDPSINTWTAVASLPQTPAKLSFLLENGNVLVRSSSPNAGTNPGTIPPVDEVYNPSADTWTVTTLPLGDPEGVSTLLQNGDVLAPVEWDCDPANPACVIPTTYLFTADNLTPPCTWSGFLQPINTDGSSIFKQKSTVNVRLQLTNSCASQTDATITLYTAKVTDNVVGSVMEAESNAQSDTGNLFHYDSSTGQYVFRLGTKNLTVGTYQLSVYYGGTNVTGALLGTVNVSLK